MRFAIIGVGGVGGYVGARLAEAGHTVTFVARGDHLRAMQASGLHVQSVNGDVHVHPIQATSDPAEVGVVDCVIVAVKAWQVGDVARSLRPLLGPDTLVVPLQNGVEASEQLAEVLGPEPVLGGIAKIISFIRGPGRIEHAGHAPELIVGELGGGTSGRVTALQQAFADVRGLRLTVSTEMRRALWEKFLFITSWGGVGAVTRAPAGVVRRLPETRALIEASLDEMARVAAAHGVRLEAESISAALTLVDSLPADGTASMQRDIAAGRPSELDNLTGAVLRLGGKSGVPTPVNGFIHAALLPLEQRARGLVAF